MGVDCDVTLPPNTRLDYVGEVLGRLFGMPTTKAPLGDTSDGAWAVRVNGVRQEPSTGDIGTGRIYVGTSLFSAFVFFNMDERGGLGLMMGAGPVELAVAFRLVKFFGGRADYNDCDATDVDISRPPRYPGKWPDDGKPWQDLQQAILDVKPLTLNEIEAFASRAAYKLPNEEKEHFADLDRAAESVVLKVLLKELSQATDNLNRAKAQLKADPDWESGDGKTAQQVVRECERYHKAVETAVEKERKGLKEAMEEKEKRGLEQVVGKRK